MCATAAVGTARSRKILLHHHDRRTNYLAFLLVKHFLGAEHSDKEGVCVCVCDWLVLPRLKGIPLGPKADYGRKIVRRLLIVFGKWAGNRRSHLNPPHPVISPSLDENVAQRKTDVWPWNTPFRHPAMEHGSVGYIRAIRAERGKFSEPIKTYKTEFNLRKNAIISVEIHCTVWTVLVFDINFL